MKKTEFALSQNVEDKLHSIDAGKHEDYEIPDFAREVPLSSRKRDGMETSIVEYDWKPTQSELIKIKRIDFRANEELGDLFKVTARDGADSITFRHNNNTYILRKTVKEVAEALYNAYTKIKGALENIVGFIRTVIGNDYVVSKVDHEAWAFDKRIAKGSVHYTDVDSLDRKSRSRLVEMIGEKISWLHSRNLIIGRFSLNNILLGERDISLTDLRKLRISRRRSYVIDEFKSVLQYLFALGLATREDVYASIAYYTAQNEEGCNEWYNDKMGKKAADSLDIVGRLEHEVYS